MIHFYARDLGEGAFLTYCLKFTHPPSPHPQNLLHVFTDFAVSVYCCLALSVDCYSEYQAHQNIGCLSHQLMSKIQKNDSVSRFSSPTRLRNGSQQVEWWLRTGGRRRGRIRGAPVWGSLPTMRRPQYEGGGGCPQPPENMIGRSPFIYRPQGHYWAYTLTTLTIVSFSLSFSKWQRHRQTSLITHCLSYFFKS